MTSHYTTYSGYSYLEPNGTVHPFPINYNGGNEECGISPSGAQTAYATDGSGFYIDATLPTSPIVKNPAGMDVKSYERLTDTNGNYISKVVVNSSETDWTDSAGHLVLKLVKNGSTIQYQWQDTTGAYQTTTVLLTSTSIKTNFACSGVVEYTGTANLPTEIDLPNGQKYFVTYEDTPNFAGYKTGRVKRITVPTGGYYEYQYPTSGNNGIVCADGSANDLTRLMNDGISTVTWHFVRTPNGSNWDTTVTAPQLPYDAASNQSVFTFNSAGQEIGEKYYQGAATGTPLRAANITWAANGTPATRTSILEDNSTQSQLETTFDNYGNLLTLKEHDWGSGGPGAIKRITTWTYVTDSAYTSRNIVNRVSRVTVADGAGTVKSRTDIAYDGGGSFTGGNCITGALQHDDANYGCSFTTRGNPTSVTTYTDPVTPSGGITKNFLYDSVGNLRQADLNCCQRKTWNYSSATQYAYPDSVVSGSSSPQLTTSATYNSYTGLPATTTDENSQITTYTSFDALKRLRDLQRPDGAHLGWTYADAIPPSQSSVTSTTPIQGTDQQKQTVTVDGLGRPIKQQITDAGGTSYSIIETQYDPLGRPYKVSNPHNSTAQYWTETRFDAIGRPTLVIPPDGTPTSNRTVYMYATNTVTVTDPAGKARKSQVDGLGRLVSIWEPDVNNGNALTQQTTYTYNELDELTQVVQGSQTRTYTFDALRRLTSATTPEAGRVCFGSVSGSTCNADGYDSFNNLLKRTDARGVLTSYGYDSLNRLSSISYNVGTSGVPATPGVTFTYGINSAQYNNGRLITINDGVGSENYSYNNLGETTQVQKVIDGTTYTIGYAHNLAGELTQITYPSGRVVQQSYDPIGRLCSVGNGGATCSTGTTFATGFAYNTAFQVTGLSYGNGVTAAFGYSAERLQLTSLDYSRPGSGSMFHLNYGYSQNGGNNGQITSVANPNEPGQSVNYTFDALNRLVAATSVGSPGYPQWGLSWTYDRYGNRLNQTVTVGSGVPSNSVSVDAATNRIITSGYAYDSSGNMTSDGSNTLVYDAENRVLSASNGGASGIYTFDGNGLRVKKVSGSTTTVYIFSGGKVIAEYDNGAAVGSPSREYVYSGSGVPLAKIEGGATTYYHSDHLSVRFTSDANQNYVAHMGQYPYGEMWYDDMASIKTKFTSYERDSESGNDYAMMRTYVNRLGRFSSPDPLAGSTGDPQSLNRYSYTLNDPSNLADPLGLFCYRDGSCVPPLPGGGNPFDFANIPIVDGYAPYFVSGVFPGIGEYSGEAWLPNIVGSGFDLLDLLTAGEHAGFFGGPMDVSRLRSNALVALLDPDCAALFGGFKNAVASLFNSTYNRYVPGQQNPLPNELSAGTWSRVVTGFKDGTIAAQTVAYGARPGGTIFFAGLFNLLTPGFATALHQSTQMTAFFHEQEHAANHNPKIDRDIDSNYPADFEKINGRCKKPQIQQESAPIPGQLTPP